MEGIVPLVCIYMLVSEHNSRTEQAIELNLQHLIVN
jgi:hypothetical protein